MLVEFYAMQWSSQLMPPPPPPSDEQLSAAAAVIMLIHALSDGTQEVNVFLEVL